MGAAGNTETATTSAGVAGTVIGSLFMNSSALIQRGGIAGWAGLHMIGGIIGSLIGITLIFAFKKRNIVAYNEILN